MAKGNPQRFSRDIPASVKLHLSSIDNIRAVLFNPSLEPEAREIIESQKEDFQNQFKEIQSIHSKFIERLAGQTLKNEVDKQTLELFPDRKTKEQETEFIKIKILYEFISSFLRSAETAWNNIYGMCKVLGTFSITNPIFKKILEEFLTPINTLNEDTRALLKLMESAFSCQIIGPSKIDKKLLVSNLIYDEKKDYRFEKVFPWASPTASMPSLPKFSDRVKQPPSETNFYYTTIKGTKDWNQNDAYILHVKKDNLKEEERKFYSSSFVILNPSENISINLAAALVRKNMGHSAAPKYNKMLQTLLDFAVTNLFSKDFVNLCDDTHTFLYHIGPIVMYNIIQEDLVRRDFGYCHYVDNNKIIKFLPESIIKKFIIDYWAEKFHDLKPTSVDAYMNYSKGFSNIRESYKSLFENAASTRKRTTNIRQSIEEYMIEHCGKFFGYRRAQVYRRFVPDNVFGILPEINSTDLVTKFKFR